MKLSKLKILYEVFDQDREKVNNAIKSIKNGSVLIDEIESGDYFVIEGVVYSDEIYVVDYSGNALHIDESFYCDGLGAYVDSEDTVMVYEGRHEVYYSSEYITCNAYYYLFNGEYYDSEALNYHELDFAEDTGEIHRSDELYYHERDGNLYTYPPDEDYCRGYHNGSYKTLCFNNKSKFKIGYEIEKEDSSVKESIDIDDFEENTSFLWRKETDSSLDDKSGYELISPTFEFDIDKIFEHIESNEILVKHINADKSTSCGGHIHLSEEGLTGRELFDKVKGYTPLFYALYYGRINKSHCKGKNNRDLIKDNVKFQAIKIHDNRIEFRIISAVPNVSTLKWRSKLLMMIIQNPTSDIMKAYYNVDTKFTKLLKQTYSDAKLLELKDRFIKYTREFEDLDIKKQ